MLTIIDKLLFLYVFSIYLYSIFSFLLMFIEALWRQCETETPNNQTIPYKQARLWKGKPPFQQEELRSGWPSYELEREETKKSTGKWDKTQVWTREGKNEWCSGVHKHLGCEICCYEVTDLPRMYPTCCPVTAGMDWDCTILQDL